MAGIPNLPTDMVVYDTKDVYLDRDISIWTMDGSEILVNGYPITLINLDGQRGDILVSEAGSKWRLNKLAEEQYTIQNGSANYQVLVGDEVGWIDPKGVLYVGKNILANLDEANGHKRVPDFAVDVLGPGRVFCRSLSMATVNDPCDLNLRRFGGFAPYGRGTLDGTVDDLIGLGVGALVGQVRATGASAINGGVVNKVVTNAVNNGSGLIRITSAGHTLTTGHEIWLDGVVGATQANGFWTVTVIDANTFDLQGSAFSSAYVSGGLFSSTGSSASSTGAVISLSMADMPRRVTSDGQTSNAMAMEVNLAPRHAHDFREAVLRISSRGNLQVGKKACEQGDLGPLLQLRAHEGKNNIQLITIGNSPTNGTFKIKYFSLPTTDTNYSIEVETAGIARNASNAAVVAALVAALITIPGTIGQTANLYSAVTSADFIATGGPLPDTPVQIEMTGILGLMPQYRMLGTNINMTGPGGDGTIVISRVGQSGIAHEKDKLLFDLQHTAGQTAGFGRIRDGAGLNVLTLDVDRKLIVGTTVRYTEMVAPSAPPVNSVEVFAQDNGSGKTQLMALFNTGAAQQLAIQP